MVLMLKRLSIALLLLFMATLSAQAASSRRGGFVPLFDGTTLDGWIQPNATGKGYIVEDGTLVCPADGGGNIYTENQYSDFGFRVEFKQEPGGNTAVALPAPIERNAAS
ncbi:MAG: DUF1080 domain-containing protein, partial [Armatimonadetes bacterium]|nr:DUF1080 domain-containing protein [Armatimonadota bacterium]